MGARQEAPPARGYDVEIVRDEWGVPHINGKSDADAAYGLAYAHAEDDFATLQEVLAMTRGRYGALAGAEGAYTFAIEATLPATGQKTLYRGVLNIMQ